MCVNEGLRSDGVRWTLDATTSQPSALHLAIYANDHDLVRDLVCTGAPLGNRLEHHKYHTPLHLAVQFLQVDLVKLLVEAGADVNSQLDMVITRSQAPVYRILGLPTNTRGIVHVSLILLVGIMLSVGRFCSTHNTYENYVRCLRTTNVKIGFACAFGPTYVVTYVFSPFLPSTWPHAGTDRRLQELQVVGDREAHSCLASGICDDAKSYDDRQTKACPLVSTGL